MRNAANIQTLGLLCWHSDKRVAFAERGGQGDTSRGFARNRVGHACEADVGGPGFKRDVGICSSYSSRGDVGQNRQK